MSYGAAHRSRSSLPVPFRPLIRSRLLEPLQRVNLFTAPSVTQKRNRQKRSLERYWAIAYVAFRSRTPSLGNSSHLYKMKFRRELAHAGEEISSDMKHAGRESAAPSGSRHVPTASVSTRARVPDGIDRDPGPRRTLRYRHPAGAPDGFVPPKPIRTPRLDALSS
jgi:hypothetical protein